MSIKQDRIVAKHTGRTVRQVRAMRARIRAMMFNADEETILCRALHAVWQQIASDCGTIRSNIEAVEMCIDANRLTFNCGYGKAGKAEGVAAQKIVSAAIAKHPYDKVLRELSKLVSFV